MVRYKYLPPGVRADWLEDYIFQIDRTDGTLLIEWIRSGEYRRDELKREATAWMIEQFGPSQMNVWYDIGNGHRIVRFDHAMAFKLRWC